MVMSENQIQESTARILDGIQLTNDVRTALNHLVKTATPLKGQGETMSLDCEPEHPSGQVSWMLRYCDVTEDQIRTCLSNATLPLPGGIKITPDVRTTLAEMVEEAICKDTLDWANSINLVQLDATDSSVKKFLNSSVEKSVNKLIETGIDEIRSAGPHYQFSWLNENSGYTTEQLVEIVQPEECDTSSGPEPG